MYVLYTHDISYIMIGIYKHIHGYCKYISDASDLKARCLVFQNRPGSKLVSFTVQHKYYKHKHTKKQSRNRHANDERNMYPNITGLLFHRRRMPSMQMVLNMVGVINAAGDLRQHVRPYTQSMCLRDLFLTNGKHSFSPTWCFFLSSSTSFDQKKILKTAILVFSGKGLRNPILKS